MEYKNRYGDVFTFKQLENGNIQWSGNFKHCRFGCPYDYSIAYEKYKEDKFGEATTLEEFIEELHEQIYDDDMHFIGYSLTSEIYGEYVTPKTDIISMVDPSGGPYISEGMDMKIFGLQGRVKEFSSNKNGFEIVIDK